MLSKHGFAAPDQGPTVGDVKNRGGGLCIGWGFDTGTDWQAQIGTDEAISQVYKNIVNFNERVPSEFQIGAKQVITSLKTRAKRRELKAAGYGKEKKYAGYYSEYIRNLDPATSEEMIPQE